MTTELVLLAASVVLGVVLIVIVSHLQSWQRGYRWTASSREHSVAPLTGISGRAERALRNYLETFPLFAAAILVASLINAHSWLTVWGAHFYFWGRIVYAILALAGAGVWAGSERLRPQHAPAISKTRHRSAGLRHASGRRR
jgi:uncharacterized MAPEG superfamily protein